MNILEAASVAPALAAKRLMWLAFAACFVLLGVTAAIGAAIAAVASIGVALWAALLFGAILFFGCAVGVCMFMRSRLKRESDKQGDNKGWKTLAAAVGATATHAPVKTMIAGVVAGLTIGALESLERRFPQNR